VGRLYRGGCGGKGVVWGGVLWFVVNSGWANMAEVVASFWWWGGVVSHALS